MARSLRRASAPPPATPSLTECCPPPSFSTASPRIAFWNSSPLFSKNSSPKLPSRNPSSKTWPSPAGVKCASGAWKRPAWTTKCAGNLKCRTSLHWTRTMMTMPAPPPPPALPSPSARSATTPAPSNSSIATIRVTTASTTALTAASWKPATAAHRPRPYPQCQPRLLQMHYFQTNPSSHCLVPLVILSPAL